MTKARARLEAIQYRQKLSSTDIDFLSQSICRLFFEMQVPNFKTVMGFLPIMGKNEPNVRYILHSLPSFSAEVKLTVPYLIPLSTYMKAVSYSDGIELEKGPYKVLQPSNPVFVNSIDLDLVLVPMLAADRMGNRVGYGGGYYDRFLAECSKNCFFLGINFTPPIDVLEDVEPTDIPMDALLWPNGWHFVEIN